MAEEIAEFEQPGALRRAGAAQWSRFDSDVAAAWLGESDLRPPTCIREAVKRAGAEAQLRHYSKNIEAESCEIASEWMRLRYGIQLHLDLELHGSPMGAFTAALLDVTKDGEQVVVLTPIYPPILHLIGALGRICVETPMPQTITADSIEQVIAGSCGNASVAAICLTNPSNPTGRVFTTAELGAISVVSESLGAAIISDEVFADLVFEPALFVSALSACTGGGKAMAIFSPNKPFSLSGCGSAVLAAPAGAKGLVRRDQKLLATPSRPALEAFKAAWTDGADWLPNALLALSDSRSIAANRLELALPDAGFFLWFEAPEHWRPSPTEHLLRHHRIAVRDGLKFGMGFGNHVRVTVSQSHAAVSTLVDRLTAAIAH